MKSSDIPTSIREFVKSKIGRNIRKYSVNRSGKFKVDIPWHDADREYWQLFKLTEHDAQITDFQVQRSGWCENQENITGRYIRGETEVPVGFVMVCVGIYPARCVIYCHSSSNFMIEDKKEIET